MTIEEMLANGFVYAPCANPECDNLFRSGEVYCSTCEDVMK